MGITTKIFGALFGVGGAILCAVGGLMLLSIQAQSENSLLEAIAHGIGVYCLGKAGAILSSATYGGGQPDIQKVTVVTTPQMAPQQWAPPPAPR